MATIPLVETEPNVPFLLALLLCDYAIVEHGTGKKSAIGIFDDVWSTSVPIQQKMAIFARLTDMEGEYHFETKAVRIQDHSEETIGKMEFSPVIVKDRLHKVDFALNLPPLTFPDFGMYEVQLFGNGVFLGRAVLNIRKREAQAT